MKKLNNSFFERKSEEVAKDLIGRHIVRNVGKDQYVGMISETGAYEGGSRSGLSYAPGDIYVAIFQGGLPTLCIGTEKEKVPSVITIRKVYPVKGFDKTLTTATLSEVFNITKALDKKSVTGNELYFEGNKIDDSGILQITPRMEKMAANCMAYYRMK